MTLAELRVGDVAVVVEIDTKPDTKRRLLDIGLTRGTEIRVKRFAPLGDPVEIALKDFSLALRKSDASKISVRKREKSGSEAAHDAGQAAGGKHARGETEVFDRRESRRTANIHAAAQREGERDGLRGGENRKTESAGAESKREKIRAEREKQREERREARFGRRK